MIIRKIPRKTLRNMVVTMKKMRGRRGGRVRDDDDDGGEGGADTASLGKFGFGVYLAIGKKRNFSESKQLES